MSTNETIVMAATLIAVVLSFCAMWVAAPYVESQADKETCEKVAASYDDYKQCIEEVSSE